LQVLLDPRIRARLSQGDIELVDFGAL
jgi:hypothetical protein